jgi:hypothetical protein
VPPGLKIFREDWTAYRSRNRDDDKIRIRCEPLCADHAGGNGAKARGLRLLGIHAAENSDQRAHVTAEIEEDGGAHEQVGTETDVGSRLGSLRREFWRRLKNLSVRTLEPIVEATLVGTTCRLRGFANVR